MLVHRRNVGLLTVYIEKSGGELEAVLQRLEATGFQAFTPKLRKGYVDDTFVIQDTAKLSDFHMVLSNASLEFSLPWIRKRTAIYLFTTY